ncbi:hypothetical protein GQ595_08425 [Gilliamella sp. Pra-s54]|nr:hypothetical protein [Gilliamella sp. Pra-s54]
MEFVFDYRDLEKDLEYRTAMPVACCLLPVACCLLPVACCLLPVACCLLPYITMISHNTYSVN